MARRERGVQRHGVEPAFGREPPGEVHLVALAGAEQLEDGVDPGFEVVAIETRPPLAARRTRPLVGPGVGAQVGGGALEEAAAVAVAAHRDRAVGADLRDRPEAREHRIGDRTLVE